MKLELGTIGNDVVIKTGSPEVALLLAKYLDEVLKRVTAIDDDLIASVARIEGFPIDE